MVGEPQYQQVPGTGIYAVTNTDSLVFWDGYAKAYYYLVAGRWFRADHLNGPWTTATNSLPADFANIPPDGPLAAVLASVPGTLEAKEAALQAQIPHLATVARSSTATVVYDGTPQFAPIDGTSLSYAVNTPSDVIRVGDASYLCQNGVWFTAASPSGPWSVAATVPDAIYTIPPSSPLFHVTYVRLYQANDDQVVYGYTDGYLGEYVADGVVTWGTGYAYAPYIGIGTAPIYSGTPAATATSISAPTPVGSAPPPASPASAAPSTPAATPTRATSPAGPSRVAATCRAARSPAASTPTTPRASASR
jgi:hypothetical protein